MSRTLSENDWLICECLLLLEELTQALQLANRNNSPGPDGLTVEFYLAFWSSLGPLLVEVFKESFSARELCDSTKSSVTRLVHKKDYKCELKNWRTISLLNTGYIDPDQTCSVQGRYIFSSLALLLDILSYIERSGETGILIALDQEKAFDRVNRAFLMELLNCFGFRTSFRGWSSTFYSSAYVRVLLNDFLTIPVYLRRGVRQGDAVSPMLYILCMRCKHV